MFVTNLQAIVFFGRMFTSHLEILFWVDEPGISLDADRPDVLEVDGSVCHRLVDHQIHTLEVFPRRKDDPADKPDGLNSTLPIHQEGANLSKPTFCPCP